jgi:hypothetical protein
VIQEGDLSGKCWGDRLGIHSLNALLFLVGLGFELRASHLQSRHPTPWVMPPVHFALVILEMGVSQTICLSWPRTLILLISASQVGRASVFRAVFCHNCTLASGHKAKTYSVQLLQEWKFRFSTKAGQILWVQLLSRHSKWEVSFQPCASWHLSHLLFTGTGQCCFH